MSSSSIGELKQIFEYELRRKLSLKAKQSTSEVIMLSNAFRFYDIFNTGTVDKVQWVKAFNKIGLIGFTENDYSFLFDFYDIHMQGAVDYKEFANNLYNDNQPQLQITEPKKKEQYEPISNKTNQLNQSTPQEYQKTTPSRNKMSMTMPMPMPVDQLIYQQNQTQENTNKLNTMTPMKFEIKKYFKYLLEVLFYNINTKNGVTYLSFASKIKILEDRFNKVISFDNFMKCLIDSRIEINHKDIRDFFSLLDLSDQGYVSTEELLRLLRGQLNEKRRILTIDQFGVLDQLRQGRCKVSEIKNRFNPKGHPEVRMGRKTENEIYQEFIYTLDTFLQLKERNTYCTLDDFIEYYSIISGCIDNDEYYKAMITSVWIKEPILLQNKNQRLPSQKENNILRYSQSNDSMSLRDNYVNNTNLNTQRINNSMIINTNNKNNNQIDSFSPSKKKRSCKRIVLQPNTVQYNPINMTYTLPENQFNNNFTTTQQQNNNLSNQNVIMNNQPVASIMKLRQLLIHRGFKGILGFQRLLRHFDKINSREIYITDFDSLCQSYCLNLSKDEINSIYSFLDIELIGNIKYDSLMNVLLGDLSDNRKKIVRKIFNLLDKDNSGQIDQMLLKQLFNPSRHPDVINRRKTEDEVLCEWIDCIDAFCAFDNIHFNRGLNLNELMRLYAIISITIEDEKSFELLLNNVWNLDRQNSNNNYKQSGNNNQYLYKVHQNSKSTNNIRSSSSFG